MGKYCCLQHSHLQMSISKRHIKQKLAYNISVIYGNTKQKVKLSDASLSRLLGSIHIVIK